MAEFSEHSSVISFQKHLWVVGLSFLLQNCDHCLGVVKFCHLIPLPLNRDELGGEISLSSALSALADLSTSGPTQGLGMG